MSIFVIVYIFFGRRCFLVIYSIAQKWKSFKCRVVFHRNIGFLYHKVMFWFYHSKNQDGKIPICLRFTKSKIKWFSQKINKTTILILKRGDSITIFKEWFFISEGLTVKRPRLWQPTPRCSSWDLLWNAQSIWFLSGLSRINWPAALASSTLPFCIFSHLFQASHSA